MEGVKPQCAVCQVPMQIVKKNYARLMIRIDEQEEKMLLDMLDLLKLYDVLTAKDLEKATRRLYRIESRKRKIENEH